METLEQLTQKAISLPPTERIRMVDAILFSLDKIDPEVEKRWIAESESRYEAYRRGELAAKPWEDIQKRFKP